MALRSTKRFLSCSLGLLLLVLGSTNLGADATFGSPSVSLLGSHRRSRGMATLQINKNENTAAALVAAIPRGGEQDVIIDSNFPALLSGMILLGMACTPYVISLFSKKMAASMLVYKTDTKNDCLEAYKAQAYWVFMYATLGLTLTLFQFIEVHLLGKMSAADVLRDSFKVWALFYLGATIKIRIEAKDKDMLEGGRFMTQLFHIIFAAGLLGAALGSEFFVEAMNWLMNLFSFGK